MSFAESVLHHRSPIFYLYFAGGWIFGAAASSLLLTSLAALLYKKCRRRMVPAASAMSLILLVAAVFCLSAYIYEAVMMMASSNPFEKFIYVHTDLTGDSCIFFWAPVASYVIPQLFWLRRCRRALWITAVVAAIILLLINLNALAVFAASQSQDFLPDSWIHDR
jgi:hypothetical protein